MHTKRAQETYRQRIETILSDSLPLSCNADFILSSLEIPQEIKKIFVTIRRGGKAIARTSCTPQSMPVDLKACLFDTFESHGKNTPLGWKEISQWRGGETYTLEVE